MRYPFRIRARWPLFLFVLTGCSSAPTPHSPEWVRQPTRTVDGGYILYVGTGDDSSPERSQFKAEAAAIQDLANECSFPPKGTRVEDRYQEKTEGHTLSFAKVGISFQDCELAKNANDPESIKKLANVPLTEQLKKYQDLTYGVPEAEATSASESSASGGNPMLSSTHISERISDPDHYFIARQQVAYVKETVILAPATVYVASAPQTQQVTQQLQSNHQIVQSYETLNPAIKNSSKSWSEFEKTTTTSIPGNIPHARNSNGLTSPSSRSSKIQPPKTSRSGRRYRKKKMRAHE